MSKVQQVVHTTQAGIAWLFRLFGVVVTVGFLYLLAEGAPQKAHLDEVSGDYYYDITEGRVCPMEGCNG